MILNDKVFVPLTGSQWDDEAIASYQTAMPGYDIVGINYYDWMNTDALHCRAHGIADRGMLYIQHTPIQDTVGTGSGYNIQTQLISYGDETLISDSLLVYWKTDGQTQYNSVQLQNSFGNLYNAQIPEQPAETTVEYYIHAADNSGHSENKPYIGAPDPFDFYVADYNEISPQEHPKNIIVKNFPNPFVNSTTFSYHLSNSNNQISDLTIFDAKGRIVYAEQFSDHSVTWNGVDMEGKEVPNGIYFYKLEAGEYSTTEKMLKME